MLLPLQHHTSCSSMTLLTFYTEPGLQLVDMMLILANIVEQTTRPRITYLYKYPKVCSLCQKHCTFIDCSHGTKFFFCFRFSWWGKRRSATGVLLISQQEGGYNLTPVCFACLSVSLVYTKKHKIGANPDKGANPGIVVSLSETWQDVFYIVK